MEGANNDPNKTYNVWDEKFTEWYINGRWAIYEENISEPEDIETESV